MTDYLKLPICELHQKIKNHIITPSMLVKEAFDKIEKSNLNAFITLNENAKEEAKLLDQMEPDNLLFGIPIAIKDNIVTKDLKTTCASKMLEDFMPIYDATVIEKLKQKHMIIIGKTNMDEFAMGSTTETSYFGACRNPWNETKVPGGSSGGSAAAVSSAMVSFALGSDTGGSIRQPSSFCGIVGMKPTYGRVSRYGLIAFASSLDQIGPMTRNVYENALLLEAISGMDSKDLTSSTKPVEHYTDFLLKEIKGFKIALPKYYIGEKVNPAIKEKIKEICTMLEANGCTVEEIDIDYLEYAIPLYQIIALGEASGNLARYDGVRYGYRAANCNTLEELYCHTRAEGFGKEVKRRLMVGSYVLSGENAPLYYHKAQMVRRELTDAFEEVFSKYDFIIGPTNTDVAYDLNTKVDDPLKAFYDDLLTIPLNMAGLPSLSLPIGFVNHLPVGMQIIASHFEEAKIYQLASFIEKELQLDMNPEGGSTC